MGTAERPRRIVVSGATGLVGSSLVELLSAAGHRVVALTRAARSGTQDGIPWDPESGRIDAARLEGVDAVVHLAGESIAAGRWNARRKQRIRASRVDGTRILSEALASLHAPPRVLLCASAVGYYGDRGPAIVDERSEAGEGFLADVCREWEAATGAASRRGVRVAHLRFGVVLARRGGALARMLPPFRLGLGGPIGSGEQFLSWIALRDAVEAIELARTSDVTGAVNLVAPQPVTSREFARALGRVLRRPAIVPFPAVAVRTLFGEMGQALLLSSCRAAPRALLELGFRFRYPEVEGALRHELLAGTFG